MKGEPKRALHRCQMPGCKSKSIFYCVECNKCLCIKASSMCFSHYHNEGYHVKDTVKSTMWRIHWRVPCEGYIEGYHVKDTLKGTMWRIQWRVPCEGYIERYHVKDTMKVTMKDSMWRIQWRTPMKRSCTWSWNTSQFPNSSSSKSRRRLQLLRRRIRPYQQNLTSEPPICFDSKKNERTEQIRW